MSSWPIPRATRSCPRWRRWPARTPGAPAAPLPRPTPWPRPSRAPTSLSQELGALCRYGEANRPLRRGRQRRHQGAGEGAAGSERGAQGLVLHRGADEDHKEGKALYLHCLPADINGVSCKDGEVEESVFDRYREALYKEALLTSPTSSPP